MNCFRARGAIPGPVKGDKGAATIRLRKLRALVDLQIVRSPVSGKCGDRRLLFRASTRLFAAVAAIFRRQHELLALAVIVALRPAVIGALSEEYHFLRWQLETLLGGVQIWPIFMQLIAAM